MRDDEKARRKEAATCECLANCETAHLKLTKAELIDLLIESGAYQDEDRPNLDRDNKGKKWLRNELCYWLCVGELQSGDDDGDTDPKEPGAVHKPPLGGKTS